MSRRSSGQRRRRSGQRHPVAQSKPPRRIRRRSAFVGLLTAFTMLGALHLLAERPAGPDIQLPSPSGSLVQLETRNPDGTLALPPGLIEGTSKLRFRHRDRDLTDDIHVFVGYHPHSVLMVNLKVYEISHLVEDTSSFWRRKARTTINLPDWRHFEHEWFEHMHGRALTIQRVLPDDAFRLAAHMRVEKVRFGPKETTHLRTGNAPQVRRSFEAVLDTIESVTGTIARLSFSVVQDTFRQILFAVVSAIATGAVAFFLQRRAG